MDDRSYLDFVKAYEAAEPGSWIACGDFDFDCLTSICGHLESNCGITVGTTGEERYLHIKKYLIEKGLYSEQLEFVF